MFNTNLVIFVVAFVAVTQGQLQQLATTNNSNSTLRTEDYINLNRQQYDRNIHELDIELEIFKQNYAASLETINIQRDMLLNTMQQNEEKINPLLVLSDLSKKCVNKYRNKIPTIATTKTKINNCVNTANNKLQSLLSQPLSSRNSLDNYYKNTYDRRVSNCKASYGNLPLNYTICVTDTVKEVNAYTIIYQKSFASQMDSAQCSAVGNIKQALDCSYVIENDVISAIAEANTLINKCLLGLDDCKPCSQGYTCSEVSYLYRSEIDYNSKTMNNPFYRRYTATECLLLKLV